MNNARTKPSICAETDPPIALELIDRSGRVMGPYQTLALAEETARYLWRGEEQDPDRTGRGWDVQVVGCDRC